MEREIEELTLAMNKLAAENAKLLGEIEQLKVTNAPGSKPESKVKVKTEITEPSEPLDRSVSQELLKQIASNIPLFHGNCNNKETMDFLTKEDVYFEFESSSELGKIAFVVQKFTNKASLWMQTMKHRISENKEPKLTDWKDLRSRIIERFTSKEYRRTVISKLTQLRQTSTVEIYVEQFETYAIQVPEVDDLSLQAHFLAGLKPFIATAIGNVESNLMDINTLKAAALRFDEINRGTRNTQFIGVTTSEEPNKTEVNLTKYDLTRENKNSKNYMNKEKDKEQKDNGKTKRFCSHCQSITHSEKKCWKLRKLNKQEPKILLLRASENQKQERFILDSGCTHHVVNSLNLLSKWRTENLEISVANGDPVRVQAIGEVCAITNKGIEVCLSNVYCVPDLEQNLISVTSLIDHGCSVQLKKGHSIVSDSNSEIFTAYQMNRLFYSDFTIKTNSKPIISAVQTRSQSNSSKTLETDKAVKGNTTEQETQTVDVPTIKSCLNSYDVWHHRLCHIGPERLSRVIKANIGIPSSILKEKSNKICESCTNGKLSRTNCKRKQTKEQIQVLQLVSTDLCGPMAENSLGGARYWIYLNIYFVADKNSATILKIIQTYVQWACTQTGKKLKLLRSDQASEFLNESVQNFLCSIGIEHQRSCVYTPQQNGVAEIHNRVIGDSVRTLLSETKFKSNMWAELAQSTVYILNRIIRKHCSLSPDSLFHGHKKNSSLDHLRILGSTAFVRVEGKRTKFEPKTTKGYLIGYSSTTKGYRVWIPETDQLLLSIHVKID